MTEDKEKRYQCTMSTDKVSEKTLQEYERKGVTPPPLQEINRYIAEVRNGNNRSKANEVHTELTDCVINVVFDHESGVWVATNDDLPITLEDASLDRLVYKLKVAVPEMAEYNCIRVPPFITCSVKIQLA